MESVEREWLAAALADRYRLDRELGRGGWGVVFLAHDLRHGRLVAIKVMEVGTGALSSRARIRQEIELEARLVHPHIVPLFDSGEVEGAALYFVMPYIDGESLQQRLAREGPLPVADALRIGRDVAEALGHAHQKGVVHRDVKPGNILLTSGSALVADFGVARVMGGATRDGDRRSGASTTHGAVPGTPTYMAPEHAAGDPSMDGRADLYSLGCVLYEMLAGHPPFDARSPGGVVARHAVDPVPPLRTVRPTVPPAVEALIARSLAKAPGDRFPNAQAMVQALDEATHAESASGPHHAARGRRWWRVTAVLVGVALVTVAGIAFSGQRQVRRLIATADTSLVVLFPFEGDSLVSEGTTEQFRRALQRWGDLRLADMFVVREATGRVALTTERARDIALRLGAGRFIRGRLSSSDGQVEVVVVISDVDPSRGTLSERSERIEPGGSSRDGALLRIADALLVRQPLPVGLSPDGAGTRSLAALQHYLRGRNAVLEWALDSAVVALDRAVRADAAFAEAQLWLAMTRFWRREDPPAWRLAALAASRDTSRVDPLFRMKADALVAFVEGDIGRACATWDALTRRDVFRFEAWYSAATCRDEDTRVVRDARSPSGWRFASSYHTALSQYLQAYQRMPSMHGALRERSFDKVRQVLYVGGSSLRIGHDPAGSMTFYAAPTLDDDTLAFVPYPAARVIAGDPAVALAQRDRGGRMLRRQRELFRDIASSWAVAEPTSVAAREAQALALQLLGDRASLDTLAHAVRLCTTSSQRRTLAGTEVWIKVRFALPGDAAALRAARFVADSALRDPTDAQDQRVQASLAALSGRTALTARIYRERTLRFSQNLSSNVAQAASDLELWAAFGGPADSIRMIAWRLDSLIEAYVPEEMRAAAHASTLRRSAWLASASTPLPTELLRKTAGDYITPILLAEALQDSAGVRRGLERLRALRGINPPRGISYDALLAEAALFARAGDRATAVQWLDEAFAALHTAPPDFDPVNAAAMVRAVALRADLAQRDGDGVTARRWASAFVALWQGADPFLQPTVTRMSMLAR